ncbi:MAG: hypothetical protein HOO86_15990 [Bacteroidales bacterium]|nr:hypothetical protein [Bacteroidales bacterium]
MIGEEFTRPLKQLSSELVGYINLRINYVGLLLGKRMAEITTQIVIVMILAGFAAIVMLLLTFAFVFWFGDNIGTYSQGFLIASAVYIIAGLVLYFNRIKLISNPVVKIMNDRNVFLDLDDRDEPIPINSLHELKQRLELMKLQVQHKELVIEQEFSEVGESLKPGNILSSLLNQTISSSAVTGAIISKLLDYFLKKKKSKKQKLKEVEKELPKP